MPYLGLRGKGGTGGVPLDCNDTKALANKSLNGYPPGKLTNIAMEDSTIFLRVNTISMVDFHCDLVSLPECLSFLNSWEGLHDSIRNIGSFQDFY